MRSAWCCAGRGLGEGTRAHDDLPRARASRAARWCHRQRRPARPRAGICPIWPSPCRARSFDFIEDLKIADGPLVSALTSTSLHGALADVWIMAQPRAAITVDALIERWRRDGMPDYAQFDNDAIFQGGHRFADSVGRVSRLCSPWASSWCSRPARAGLPECDRRFQRPVAEQGLAAPSFPRCSHAQVHLGSLHRRYRAKTAGRAKSHPAGVRSPTASARSEHPLKGTIIFLRRSNEAGADHMLGTAFPVDKHWVHRLGPL